MSLVRWIPSDGQTAPTLDLPLPWRKHGYRAYVFVILAGGIWRPWRWRFVVV